MNDDTTRAVSLTRLGHGRYEAVNARGGTVEFSTDREQTFTPVELFLASVAGCAAIDVDSPDDDGGRAAAGVLSDAVARSHDRLCTVSRTIEIGTPVAASIADDGATQT